MNEFDQKAAGWDNNPMHWDRSLTIANEIINNIPLNQDMTVLEYGAGTGITSFLIKDNVKTITMMDNSAEMVKIMNEKIRSAKAKNLNAMFFDLEQEPYTSGRFDFVMTQMVLHHVTDIENIINRFYNLINPGGYLAIADLYPEDGSFHGEGFNGHLGFDVDELATILAKNQFINISHKPCFIINKEISDSETKQFDVFLLIANKLNNSPV